MCWIISASIKLVQCISMRRLVYALSGILPDLLKRWSDLCEPFAIADSGCQAPKAVKEFLRQEAPALLPAVTKAQGKCPLLPMLEYLCPVFFVIASLCRNQLLCGRLGI